MKKLVLAMAGLVIILAMLCPVTAAASNKDSERFPVETALLEHLVFNVDFSTGTGNDLCGGTLAENGINIEEDSTLGVNVGVCGEYYNRYEVASGLITASPLNEMAYEAFVYLSSEQTPWSHIISSRNENFDMTDYAGWKGPLIEDPNIGLGMRIGNQYIYVPSDEMTAYYDQWIHVVIQLEFGEGFIYINGDLIAAGTYDISSSAAQGVAGINQSFGEIFVGGLDTATIGAPGTDSGDVMDTVEGKIAYVRMYNTYLEDRQISDLYNTTKTGELRPEPTFNATNNTSERFPVDDSIQENLVFNVDFSTGTGDDLCGGLLAKNDIKIENDSILGNNVGICGQYYNRYEITNGLIDASPLNEFAYEAYVYLDGDNTPWSYIISSRYGYFSMVDCANFRGPLANDPEIYGLGMFNDNNVTAISSEEMTGYYDQWIHIVVQGKNRESFIYINSELVATGVYDPYSVGARYVEGGSSSFGEIFVGGIDIVGKVGTDSGFAMDTMEGKIAYVRMYDTFLEDSQISTLYQTAITPVTGPVFGDVNGDGEINPMDATILNRYNACWPTYVLGTNIIGDNCDLNNDGNINPLDGTILARHNANWSSFISLPWGINT